jgi:diguanylate cyclase (GGDEF)-like protein
MVDIDHFKMVNDTRGHLAGDAVLRETASLLRSRVRESDFIGRWGGEEFLIVCPETAMKGAARLAEDLRSVMERHIFAGVGIKTASFGVVTVTRGSSVDRCISMADEALYAAKRAGRNRVAFGNEAPEL